MASNERDGDPMTDGDREGEPDVGDQRADGKAVSRVANVLFWLCIVVGVSVVVFGIIGLVNGAGWLGFIHFSLIPGASVAVAGPVIRHFLTGK